MPEFEPELPINMLDDLKLGIAKVKGARSFIAKQKIAKMDVTDLETQLDKDEQRLRNIQRGFFPNEVL